MMLKKQVELPSI